MCALRLAAIVLLLALPADGLAAPILGRKLIVRDPNSSEERRTVIVVGKETATDVGTLSDPTAGGATIQLIASGATSTAATYTLDAAGWVPVGNGYRYAGPTTGDPVKQVLLRKTPTGVALLKVVLRGNTGTQDLSVRPPVPGDEAQLLLDVTGGDRYCVSFGGAAGGTETQDTATQWKVINATAEPACSTSSLPACSGEFTPCGTCGDGICVQHLPGSPPFVCASQSGHSAGTCSSNAECTAPRECSIPPGPPCPSADGQCLLPCATDAVCESASAGFCASVFCLGEACLLPCF